VTRASAGAQVYKPLDRIGLYGQDSGNDLQGAGTYYCVAGHSGQGARRWTHLLPPVRPSAVVHAPVLHAGCPCMGVWRERAAGSATG